MGTEDKAVTAEERVRLYLKLVDSPSLAEDIVYDKRFKTEAWPRTGYCLQRSDLEAVLADLDAARSEVENLNEQISWGEPG